MVDPGQPDNTIAHASSLPRRVTSSGLIELLDLSPDALLIVNQAGTIIMANEQASELFGYNREELQGHLLELLLPESLHALHAAHRQHYFTAPRTRSMSAGLPLFGQRKDGTSFLVDISLRPVLLQDELLAIGAIRDVSEQRRDDTVAIVESRQSLMLNASGRPTAILEINRDISERRRLEQVAQVVHAETVARLSLLQQIVDALPSSIYLVYGAEARLLLANRAASSLWGAAWRIDQPMQEFLATNGISVFDVQGRPLALADFATLRAVGQREYMLPHLSCIELPNRRE